MNHIREVGPHPHVWRTVFRTDNGTMLQECEACGTRRADDGQSWYRQTATTLPRWIERWLAGGELEVRA